MDKIIAPTRAETIVNGGVSTIRLTNFFESLTFALNSLTEATAQIAELKTELEQAKQRITDLENT